ncbi:MAG: hypothetical protein GY854_27840 [Deltaproteobacteria bacterium]|nr:hypothetical protein [Deltaproteobacteria bacterium]
MNERIRWISYKGKQIHYSDYRGLNEEEFVEEGNLGFEVVKKNLRPNMLSLVDFTDAIVGTEGVAIQRKIADMVKPYSKKTAVLGITGIKKSLLVSINYLTGVGARPFDDETQAKEWLVKD